MRWPCCEPLYQRRCRTAVRGPPGQAHLQPVPRPRRAAPRPGLDVSGLTGVVEVDPDARTADVQGMCTYEHLVDATLPHGLMPLVVPQLRTITLGGAVTGLGIESTSFRNGLPHESVLEMDILTGAGEIVTAAPTASTPTCSAASPTPTARSATPPGCAIELEPVAPYVAPAPRAVRRPRRAASTAIGDGRRRRGSWDGEPVDFVDGVGVPRRRGAT